MARAGASAGPGSGCVSEMERGARERCPSKRENEDAPAEPGRPGRPLGGSLGDWSPRRWPAGLRVRDLRAPSCRRRSGLGADSGSLVSSEFTITMLDEVAEVGGRPGGRRRGWQGGGGRRTEPGGRGEKGRVLPEEGVTPRSHCWEVGRDRTQSQPVPKPLCTAGRLGVRPTTRARGCNREVPRWSPVRLLAVGSRTSPATPPLRAPPRASPSAAGAFREREETRLLWSVRY